MNRLSDLIKAVKEGDRFTSDQLLPLVYQDLRKLAASKLAKEKPGQTLQPTALVHEAYLRLVETGNDPKWQNLRHFFAATAEAMRWILVDRARSKNTQKNGGQFKKVSIDLDQVALDSAPVDLLAFNETLDQLASIQPSHAEMVKLRFFMGLTLEEAAQVMGVSLDKIKRDWTSVRAWLYDKLESAEGLAP